VVDLHDFGDAAAVGIGDIVGVESRGGDDDSGIGEDAWDRAGEDSDNIEIGWFGVGGWPGVTVSARLTTKS
jgi:hypothetical protein